MMTDGKKPGICKVVKQGGGQTEDGERRSKKGIRAKEGRRGTIT